jgi:hypothetical protein
MARITNINTLSALIDRLIVERIKYSSFEEAAREKAGKDKKTFVPSKGMNHQLDIIKGIKRDISTLLDEVYVKKSYNYHKELRTTKGTLVNMIEKLIINNLDNRGSERYRIKTLSNGKLNKNALMDALKTDLWLRIAVEDRANNKNTIDASLKKYVEKARG